AGAPRSYNVQTPRGVLRRNSFHLVKTETDIPHYETEEDTLETPESRPHQIRVQSSAPPPQRTTRSGRPVDRPLRLIEQI
ncbi:unnamed protein product, partial [Allacma fusca]